MTEGHEEYYTPEVEEELREIRGALFDDTIAALRPTDAICLPATATVHEAVQKMLARASDRVSLVIKQLLDADDAFYVAAAVHALPGAAFDGLELRKFSFPEAEHVRGQATEASDLADAEIQLLRDQDLAGLARLSVVLFPGTHAACEKWAQLGRKASFPLRRF